MSLPRIVYCGTPELAVPPLRTVVEKGLAEVAAVITQPDKPSGRGQQLRPPPVKAFAAEAGIPVFQPSTLKPIVRTPEGLLGVEDSRRLESVRPMVEFLNAGAPWDLFLVVAYGKIIPPSLLRFPRRGIVNIHYSLLPHWRGAAPIQWAVLGGDAESGVSMMQIDEGLDTGPVYAMSALTLAPNETSGSLADRLSDLGCQLLTDTLADIAGGRLTAKPQDEASRPVSYAAKLEREHFTINWSEPAELVARRVRAAAPFPGARTALSGEDVKVFAASVKPAISAPAGHPGEVVLVTRGELVVATGAGGYVGVTEMQLPGRKRLPVSEVLRGRDIPVGSRFGD